MRQTQIYIHTTTSAKTTDIDMAVEAEAYTLSPEEAEAVLNGVFAATEHTDLQTNFTVSGAWPPGFQKPGSQEEAEEFFWALFLAGHLKADVVDKWSKALHSEEGWEVALPGLLDEAWESYLTEHPEICRKIICTLREKKPAAVISRKICFQLPEGEVFADFELEAKMPGKLPKDLMLIVATMEAGEISYRPVRIDKETKRIRTCCRAKQSFCFVVFAIPLSVFPCMKG